MSTEPERRPEDTDVKCYALVPAAGSGSRAETALPKQYALLGGLPVVARTLYALAQVQGLAATMVVLAPDDDRFETLVPGFNGSHCHATRCGGSTRAESVARGLEHLQLLGARPQDWVLVHDAARCLLNPEAVERLIRACLPDPVGGLLALPVADTLKSSRDGRAVATVDRNDKWVAQTPQMFRIGMLREALASAGSAVTDEASAIEHMGHAPLLVRGDPRNLKITWPQDFALAEQLLLTPSKHSRAGDARS